MFGIQGFVVSIPCGIFNSRKFFLFFNEIGGDIITPNERQNILNRITD